MSSERANGGYIDAPRGLPLIPRGCDYAIRRPCPAASAPSRKALRAALDDLNRKDGAS